MSDVEDDDEDELQGKFLNKFGSQNSLLFSIFFFECLGSNQLNQNISFKIIFKTRL